MQNPKSLSELLARGGNKLTHLRSQSAARASTLDHVRAALPPRIAREVVSAGVEQGRLTIGVTSAAWASRLRYLTESLRKTLDVPPGNGIQTIRVRVVPPGPAADKPVPAADK